MELNMIKPVKQLDKKMGHVSQSNHTHFPEIVDQIFKWTPLASILLLNATGAKTKNDFQGHLLLTTTAEALMNSVLEPLKSNVDRIRPNHSPNPNSFPSKHTATAFLGAEILRHELKNTNPILGYSGFAIAAATGALRIYNNKHWLSDVIVGAILGIASAKATYWILKKMKFGVH